jgi:hypothetical protein
MNTALLLLGVGIIPLVFLGMLLFVVLFLAIVIALLTRSNQSGAALGMTLLGVLVALTFLAFFGIYMLRSSPTVVEFESMDPAPAFVPAPPPAPLAPPAEGLLKASSELNDRPSPVEMSDADVPTPTRPWDPWDRVVEQTFRTEMYCSIAGAEHALTRDCLSELGPHLAETPETVYVVVNPLIAEQSALGSTLDGVIHEALPLATVQRAGSPLSPNPGNAIVLVLDLPEFQLTEMNALGTQASGTVSLRGTCGDHVFAGTKRFTEKPWVSHFEEFVNTHPQRTMLRANCRSFSTEEAAAYEDAVNVAVQALLPRAMALLMTQPDGPAMAIASQPAIRQQLRAAIERNELVADRFSQRLEGSSGTVWRATLLLDYRPTQLTRLANQALEVSEFEQHSRIVTGMAVALMFGLVAALYLVVNELTKGYFVWNLRAAAMLALLTIVVAVCWWIR